MAYRPAIERSAIHTGAAPDHAAPGLRHPRRLVVVALVGFLASAVVAWSDRPPSWELRITEWLTKVPDAGVAVLWPVMQLGTAWAPLLAAAVVLAITRDGRRATVTLLAGLASWFLAKAVKELFQRGRPLEFLPSIDVREGAGTGLGFVSGHAAVAATCAVCIVAALPVRIRPVAAAIAGARGSGQDRLRVAPAGGRRRGVVARRAGRGPGHRASAPAAGAGMCRRAAA